MRVNKLTLEALCQYCEEMQPEYLSKFRRKKTWTHIVRNDYVRYMDDPNGEMASVYSGFEEWQKAHSNLSRLPQTTLKKLKDESFKDADFEPIKSGTILDELFSKAGGVMPATNVLCIGDPGIGKSTALLYFITSVMLENPNKRILYISAEMNSFDLKEYNERIPLLEEIDILYMQDYIEQESHRHFESVLNEGWDLVLIDSLAECVSILANDMEKPEKRVASWVVDVCKKHNAGNNKLGKNTCFLIIQQVTKTGEASGSNKLIHNTSAMLEIRRDKFGSYAMMRKNRRGSTMDKLYFTLGSFGLNFDVEKYREDIAIKNGTFDMSITLGEESPNFDYAKPDSPKSEWESFADSAKEEDCFEETLP